MCEKTCGLCKDEYTIRLAGERPCDDCGPQYKNFTLKKNLNCTKMSICPFYKAEQE